MRDRGASGINCANSGPLMQGEGLASSPVVTQFSGGRGEQGPAGPQGPPGIQGEQGPAGPKQELQLSTTFQALLVYLLESFGTSLQRARLAKLQREEDYFTMAEIQQH